MKKNIITLFLFVGILMGQGCVELPNRTGGSNQPQMTIEGPKIENIMPDELSEDIHMVVAAILHKIRNTSESPDKITFDPNGTHNLFDGDTFRGFSATKLSIAGYQSELIQENEAKTTLEGVLLLKDEYDRSAGVYFAVQYMVTMNGVNILASQTSGVPSHFPRIEAYIVPHSVYKAAQEGSLNNYLSLYSFALKNAIPMVSSSRWNKGGTLDEYLFFVFCKDRIFDDSHLEMKITTASKMRGDELITPKSFNENGFRFFMGAGKFHPSKHDDKFYIGVKYTMNPAERDTSVLVADYSNQIQYKKEMVQ